MTVDAQLQKQFLAVVAEQPYSLLFTVISGAHMYGFPSPDSDYDLRGVHMLPIQTVAGLDEGDETIERSFLRDEIEFDLVTHDIKKFFLMMLKKNGYVLEQVFSPLIIQTTPEHAELKQIARGCVTRHHSHHYFGLSNTSWQLFSKERRVKPLLYAYRAFMTGIHLMRTGEIEANLPRLNEIFNLPYIPDLIARKTNATERAVIGDVDLAFHEGEYARLRGELQTAHEQSQLPEKAISRDLLNDLLVRIRVAAVS